MSAWNSYLILRFFSALFLQAIFTVNLLYQAQVVGLGPLQMVLVGRALELSGFLFEIPTGILADVKSRRLSILIGTAVTGCGFMIVGFVPVFEAVVFGHVVWGLGYTFCSGATEAWIVDEVGETRAADAFTRGAQWDQIGAFAGIGVGVGVGLYGVQAAVVAGGAGMLLLAIILSFVMPERGFVPVSKEERRTWGAIRDTVAAAQSLTRRQRGFGLLLTVSFVYGLHSEGFDRLWVPHVLAIGLPANLQPVIWFGLASACARALGVLTVEVARRRVDMVSKESLMRALQVISVLLVVSITAIALSGHWWLALLLYCMERALHAGSQPLYYTWLNLHIDRPQVRATIFSVNSQMNAIGQVFGGPVAGAVGERLGLRAALLSSALLLLPVVPLYALLLRKSK